MASRNYQTAEDQADRLLRQKTVAEIKSIEKQTRNDIERKKEELRQTVGERYRELIDAADTIVDMKNSASKVMADIGHMQQQCRSLHKLHQHHSVAAITTDQERSMLAGRLSFFSLVSQIKLLVNMPEKVWSVLEARDHLCAARLCIMARHIMDSVNQMTASGELRSAVKSFPILPRQWAAISHFPALVLQASRASLQDANLPLKTVEESLTAIMLLEGCSLNDVFQELLRARKTAVETLFSAEQGLSFKVLACRLVWLIRTTVQQVFAIFGAASNGASSRLLELAGQSVSSSDLQLGHWSRFLPPALQDFRASKGISSLDASPSPVDAKPVCERFLAECASLISASLSRALSFVDSLENLVSVRDSVYDLLLKDDSMPGDSPPGQVLPADLPSWDMVCEAVVGHKVVLFDELMRASLQARMEELICSQLSLACSTVHKSISALLAAVPRSLVVGKGTAPSPMTVGAPSSLGDASSQTWLDRNVGAYIWQDSPDDLSPAVSSSSRRPNRDAPAAAGGGGGGGGRSAPSVMFNPLAMKARGVTPAVAGVCSQFEADLTALIAGVKRVVGASDKASASPVRRRAFFSDEKVDPVPFDKFASASQLRSYVRLTSFDVVSRLLERLSEELIRLRSSAEDMSLSPADRAHGVDCCLLLARLASALSECCPSLEACLLGCEAQATKETSSRFYSRRGTNRSALSLKADENLAERQQQLTAIKDSINQLVLDAYSIWTASTVSTLTAALRNTILTDKPRTILIYAMAWEEVKIEEEGEEGRKVDSTIRLPMQVSTSVSSSLFLLCEEVSRIGGHTLPRSVQHSLVKLFGDRLLDIFEEAAAGGGGRDGTSDGSFSNPLAQPRALQLLFDLKCAATLLGGRGDKPTEASVYNNRVRSLVSWLETCIDPFDLDVFEPYLAANLSRCVQRCSALYGALHSLARNSSSNFVGGASALAAAATSGLAVGKSAAGPEQHNVIPMAASINRLPLLPVGTGMTTAQSASSSSSSALPSGGKLQPPKMGGGLDRIPVLVERMEFFSLHGSV